MKNPKIGRGISLREQTWKKLDALCKVLGQHKNEIIEEAVELKFSSTGTELEIAQKSAENILSMLSSGDAKERSKGSLSLADANEMTKRIVVKLLLPS